MFLVKSSPDFEATILDENEREERKKLQKLFQIATIKSNSK